MDDHLLEISKQGEPLIGIPELELEKEPSSSLESLELLKIFGSRKRHLHLNQKSNPSNVVKCSSPGRQELSTTEVIKLATAKFMDDTSLDSGDVLVLLHPFDASHSGFSCEVAKNMELILFLLASAKKYAEKQTHRARKLLSMCNHLASSTGNPVERVAYYFAEALGDKIDRETGVASPEIMEGGKIWHSHLVEVVAFPGPSALAYRNELPFIPAVQHAGMQIMLDSMSSARKIHMIDLEIGSGSHWISFMQALSVRNQCPLEMLKITVVGTTTVIQMLETTGRRLSSFAETMSLSFSFNLVVVSDMNHLPKDYFEFEAGEAVGIYSAFLHMNLKGKCTYMENIIRLVKNRLVKNCHPFILVVADADININTDPAFMDRFTEALFYFGAHFDAFDTCMEHNDPRRITWEADFFRGGIRNIITFESEDRTYGHMKIDGWRDFFTRFGMIEQEMSMSCLYQARLMVKESTYGSSCTLDKNGKCLLLGWKGTPLFSLSAWKFLQSRGLKRQDLI